MNDDSLFDWEEEWTPKIPVQIFIDGEDTTGAGLTEAGSLLNTFFTELHASTLDQKQFHAELEGGGSIAISHIFGVTQVDIALNPPKKEETTFYGGILLQPSYIVDETTFFGSFVTASDPTTVLVDEVRSAGTDDGQGGRLAVPGTLTTDETDWLVVQIAKNKPLGGTPITSGTVKIFRIKNPQFGEYIETNDTANTYLLSASLFPLGLTFGFEKFYLCGQQVVSIPPLELPASASMSSTTTDSNPQLARIRTFGMQFDSFETAYAAQGIVIVAVRLRLYVLDTANPTWLLLDSLASFDNMNDYGTDFSEVTVGNVTTITCSGSNGAGVCSGFEVVITEHEGANATFTGRIFPMADGTVAAGAPTYTLKRKVSSNSSIVSTPVSVDVQKFYDPFPNITTVTWGGTYSSKVGDTEVHAEGSFTEGTPAKIPDKFLGGFLPTYPQISYTFTHDWKITFSIHASGTTSYLGGPGAGADLYLAKYWSIVKKEVTESGTMNYNGNALGNVALYTTYTHTSYGLGIPGDSSGSVPAIPSPTSSSSGSTVSFPKQPTQLDPKVRFKYIGSDLHTDQLRMRREEIRSATTRTLYVENWGSGFTVREGESPVHKEPFAPIVAGGPGCDFSSPQMPIVFMRRGGEIVYSWPDTLTSGPTSVWQNGGTFGINAVTSFTRRGGETNYSYSGSDYSTEDGSPIGVVALPGTAPPTVSDLNHTGGPGSLPVAIEFLDYAAWAYPGGSDDLTIFDPATGDPYDQYLTPQPTGTTDPRYVIAATPWSIELTYPGNYPTVPLEYSDYALLFPMSKHALMPFSFNGPGAYVNPAKFALPNPPFTPIVRRGFLPGIVDEGSQQKAIILRDLRSGGYIAQLRVAKYNGLLGIIGLKRWHTHEVFIGNDFDFLPLETVLEEWKNLGSNSGSSTGKHIFTQFSAAPALL